MSSYIRYTKHPETNKFEPAVWIDDYFRQHHYGVKFKDGKVFDPEKIELETNDKQDFDFDKEWNEIMTFKATVSYVEPKVYCSRCKYGTHWFPFPTNKSWQWCEKPLNKYVGNNSGAIRKIELNKNGDCPHYKVKWWRKYF